MIFDAILHHAPTAPVRLNPDVPPKLEEIINRALEKDRDIRFQSAADIRAELKRLKRDSGSDKSASLSSVTAAPATGASRQDGDGPRAVRPGWVVPLAASSLVLVIAAAAFIYQQAQSAPGEEAQPPSALVQRPLTQLTFDPGLGSDPTWSPDGSLIAYSSDRSGNFDIWVQQEEVAAEPVQTTSAPAHDWQPDWSPDGKLIVFRSERDGGGLFVVPALGGHVRRLSSFGYKPSWSPDGSQILFRSIFMRSSSEPPRLYVVALDGRQPKEVLGGLVDQYTRIDSVAWHPDGQRLSLWGRPTGQSMVLLSDIATCRRRRSRIG